MSLAGLKKQFNKANQYMSEKIGGAEATKLTDDFVEMERKTDVTNELVEDLIVKTKEYLQPNPATRAKLMAASKISKLSGQNKNNAYPQPEGTLGESMVKYGRALGEDGLFAQSLIEAGESMKQMADIKYALEDNVRQNFLEPLHQLQTKELKDVMHHRKKLSGRRLDYDCKKRKQTKGGDHGKSGAHVTDDEIRMAEDKFDESLTLAQMGMHHLLENDIEQISQLAALAEGLLEYHKQCADVIQTLTERLIDQKNDAANRPRKEFIPKKLHEIPGIHDEEDGDFNGAPPSYSSTFPASPLPSPMRSPMGPPPNQTPHCKALYDFDAENDGELGFKESDIIMLTKRIDENWYEGIRKKSGQKGFFPVNYVDVVVPIP